MNIVNICLDADNKDRLTESKEEVAKAIDAITLLVRASKQITFEHKERLRCALSEDYRGICDQDHSSSKFNYWKRKITGIKIHKPIKTTRGSFQIVDRNGIN